MRRALIAVVLILAALGVISAAARVAVQTTDDKRWWLAIRQDSLGLLTDDPARVAAWSAETDAFEKRYDDHGAFMLAHVIGGGLFLLFAPLQFSTRFRNRHLTLHRWLGRALVGVALVSAFASFLFGLVIPFGGAMEVSSVGFFGALFVFALVRAVIAIRQRDVLRHREWMIRALAVAIGISSIRIAGIIMQIVVPQPVPVFMGQSFWIGWGATVLAAEWWIRRTRSQPLIFASPANLR